MATVKQKRERSPNYPVMSLKSGVDYVRKLHKYAKHHWVPLDSAFVEAWGMKAGSAYGKQVVAALKAFGLASDQGSGAKRQVCVTETGAKIVDGHTSGDSLLREAALQPKLHAELWERYE